MDSFERGRNLEVQKEVILRFIQSHGPSLPVHISTQIRMNSFISSAFLADLLSDKELKISNLRVGNSPLYFLPGQEFQLERFSNYLPGKEREAFHLLKEKGVLREDYMLPAIRVALRSIKDFSFRLEYNGRVYWRYLTVSEEDALKLIQEGRAEYAQIPINTVSQITPTHVEIRQEPVSEEVKVEEIKKEVVRQFQEAVRQPSDEIPESNINLAYEPEVSINVSHSFNLGSDPEKPKKIKKTGVKEKPEFIIKIENYLSGKNITFDNPLISKKKDFKAILSIQQNKYLCVAKDKKSVTFNDLISVLEQGQKMKLPVMFICTGEPNKKAQEWLNYLGNLLVFRRI